MHTNTVPVIPLGLMFNGRKKDKWADNWHESSSWRRRDKEHYSADTTLSTTIRVLTTSGQCSVSLGREMSIPTYNHSCSRLVDKARLRFKFTDLSLSMRVSAQIERREREPDTSWHGTSQRRSCPAASCRSKFHVSKGVASRYLSLWATAKLSLQTPKVQLSCS